MLFAPHACSSDVKVVSINTHQNHKLIQKVLFSPSFCTLFSAGAGAKYGEIYHMAYGLEELQLRGGRERGWQRTYSFCTIVMKSDHGIYDSKDVQIIIVK